MSSSATPVNPAFLHKPFVGRDSELETIGEMLDSAIAGVGSLVIVSGEAGVGKTRLAHEIRRLAEARGFVTAVGENDQSAGTPAAWVWTQILRRLFETVPMSSLEGVVHAYPGHSSELLPEIRAFGAPIGQVAIDDPESERFHRFDAVAEFFRFVSHEVPLCLIIEDLQQSDEQSLLLLEFLAYRIAEMRGIAIVTARSSPGELRDRAVQALAAIERSASTSRIELTPLGRSDVERYIEQCGDGQFGESVRDRVFERSGGLPLYLVEIVNHVMHGGRATDLPAGILHAIGARLDALPESCRSILEVASLLGVAFDLVRLGCATGIDPVSLRATLEHAILYGIIERDPGAAEHFRFRHQLFSESLAERVPESRRSEYHRLIAAELETHWGAQASRHSSELLMHLLAAGRLADPDLVIRHALSAGERALEELAFDDAKRFFSAGLELLDSCDVPEIDRRRADLLFGAVRSRTRDGNRDVTHETLRRSYEIYEALGDCDASIAVASIHFDVRPEETIDVSIYDRALGIVASGSAEEARVRANRGRYRYPLRDGYAEAREDLDRALEIARSLDDPQLCLRILDYLIVLEKSVWKFDRYEALLEEAERYAPRAGFSVFLEHIWDEAYHWYDAGGDSERARRYASLEAESARRTRRELCAALGQLAEFHMKVGEWREAKSLIDECIANQPSVFTSLMLAQCEAWLGNTGEADRLMAELFDRAMQTTDVRSSDRNILPMALVGELECKYGIDSRWIEAAISIYHQWHAAWKMKTPALARWHLIYTGHFACIHGDRGEAERVYLALDDIGPYLGPLKARLAATAGRTVEALDRFRELRDRARRGGYTPSFAFCSYEIARLLSGSREPERRVEACRAIRESVVACRSVNYTVLLEKAESLAASLGIDPDTPEVGSGANDRDASANGTIASSLSPRELEVLACLGSGMSNREIATRLYISEKTVHNHLSHIFAKLDVANRTEAAVMAVSAGIVKR